MPVVDVGHRAEVGGQTGQPARAGAGSRRRARAADHQPALDGLRGLAVAAVVAFHLGLGWAKGGYLGVDTFLVLSGYLITSGLLREHGRSGAVGLRAFWARRARRLAPALVVVLGAAGVWASTAMLPDAARSLRLDGVAALGFVANWRFVVTGQGYFGQSAAPSLLRHTWSLAVEAQLYLLWPLVVLAVLRRGTARRLATVAGLLATASAALAVVLVARSPGHDVTRAYYGTDTRAAAFLVGAAVAAALAAAPLRRHAVRPTRRWLTPVAWAAAAASAWWWSSLDGASPWLFRGGLAAAALGSATLMAEAVVHPAGVLARALSWRPLRGLGKVSYGVYLWHWPLFLVLTSSRTGLSGPALLAVRLGATAAATALSWVLVERPVLSAGPLAFRGPRARTLATAALAGALGLLLVPVGGTSSADPRLVASRRSDAAATPAADSAGLAAGAAPTTAMTAAPLPPVRAAVLGDSVALTLGRGLQAVAADYDTILSAEGTVGCGVAVGRKLVAIGHTSPPLARCAAWQTDWADRLAADQASVAVLVLGRWEVLDRFVGTAWGHVGQPAFDAYLAGQLDAAVAIAGAGGRKVIVCTAPYFHGAERPQGGVWPENEPARVDRFNQLVRELAARHPEITVFDLNADVSPQGRFTSTIDGVAVRSADGVHFSPEGGAYVAARLLPLVVQLGRSAG